MKPFLRSRKKLIAKTNKEKRSFLSSIFLNDDWFSFFFSRYWLESLFVPTDFKRRLRNYVENNNFLEKASQRDHIAYTKTKNLQ